MENQGIFEFFKDMKREEIPEFFDRLMDVYGNSIYYSAFRKKLESYFDEIVAADKLWYVLNVIEEEYVGSVKIEMIRREGLEGEKAMKETNLLLTASVYNMARASEFFGAAAEDLQKRTERALNVVKEGIVGITGVYAEEVLKKARPKNKLPA